MATTVDLDEILTLPTQVSKRELKSRYDAAAQRAADYVKQEHPKLAGILVHGSVARGEPGPFSDIDLVGIVTHGKKPSEFSFFDRGVYVGVGFLSVGELEEEFTDPRKFFWARGSADATRVYYDPQGILRRILAEWRRKRPSNQLLEKRLWDQYHQIIEYSGKLRNGWFKHDQYMIRYSAMIIAEAAERAITALNDLSIISENYLWHQILGAEKRPRHLRTDYPVARGLTGVGQTRRVYQSAMRLCGETLRLIREQFGNRATHPQFRQLLMESLESHGL